MSELFDEFLKYGLYFGAIFQLICIAAVVFVPYKDENKEGSESSDEGDHNSAEGSPRLNPQKTHNPHPHRRTNKEKKKRR